MRKPTNVDIVLKDLFVKYESRLWTRFNESPFAGPPSPAVDEAWHDLMGNMSIRVTREELDQNHQTSVELPSGGYLAWLGMFHELHCVVNSSLLWKTRSGLTCFRKCCDNGIIEITITQISRRKSRSTGKYMRVDSMIP